MFAVLFECSIIHFEGSQLVIQNQIVNFHLEIFFVSANRADTDERSQNVALYLVLNCLPNNTFNLFQSRYL